MTRCTLIAAAIVVACSPIVSAQTMDHSHMNMPGMDHSQMQETSPRKPAGKRNTKQKSVRKKTPQPMQGMDHSSMQGMDHSRMQGMDHSQMQEMDHGSMQVMDHSGMQHGAAPKEPITPIPPLTDADRAAATPPPGGGHEAMGSAVHSYMLLNRLEGWNAKPGRGFGWEAQGWIGTDLDRVWLRSEGDREHGRTGRANLEALYGHSVSPWWDVVAGVRHDFKPGSSQSFAAIGVQGLAPQKFEVAAMAYFGQRGQTAARFEAEYELLFTNRLILQPLVEVNLYGKNDPARGIGSGLSTAEAGLRLRYEFNRRFAPYIGVTREQAFGRTADFRRDAHERSGDTRVVIGLRTWF